MAPRKAKPEPRRGELRRTITLTLEADEETLDRLAAMLLFARYPNLDKREAKTLGPLPWEEHELAAVEEQVPDPAAARLEIAGLLRRYIDKHGPELARRMLAEYDASKLSEIPEARLGAVLADLKRSLAVAPKGTT